MAGQRQKPPSQLANQRGGRGQPLNVIPATAGAMQGFVPPPAPRGLLPYAQESWRRLMRSRFVGRLIDLDSDLPALTRWARALSEIERLRPLAEATPLVTGPSGKIVANPLYAIIREHTRVCEKVEQDFGMTPLARMRLGVALGAAHDVVGQDILPPREQSLESMPDLDALEAEYREG